MVAAIDLIAIGVLQALLQFGVRVPDDISLVGYDDVPFGRQLSVPLTSVRRPHYEMGAMAAELLIAAVAGDPLPRRHVVFDPNSSCGPRRRPHALRRAQTTLRRSSAPLRRERGHRGRQATGAPGDLGVAERTPDL